MVGHIHIIPYSLSAAANVNTHTHWCIQCRYLLAENGRVCCSFTAAVTIDTHSGKTEPFSCTVVSTVPQHPNSLWTCAHIFHCVTLTPSQSHLLLSHCWQLACVQITNQNSWQTKLVIVANVLINTGTS